MTSQPLDGVQDVLPLAELVELVETQLECWGQQEGHTPVISEMYINGSYGARAAHPDSDIDITLGFEDAELDTCLDAVAYLYSNIRVFDDWWEVDPCILPVGPYLYAHLEDKCEHGGYDTVYDVYERQYVLVDQLR
jgi:predicted nucleotidyltransferase